jgi:hypothetical protein
MPDFVDLAGASGLRDTSSMSRDDIETLRAGYEAFSRGDWDALVRDAHPDLKFKTADRDHHTNLPTYRAVAYKDLCPSCHCFLLPWL